MTKIVASGQITLVDLNDAQSLTSYITSNTAKIQIYDSYNASYTPNWATTNAVLIPNLFLTGANTQIIGDAKSVTWDVNGTTITSGSGGYTIATYNSANPYALTIAQNKLSSGTPNLRYTATIVWTDTNFGVDVTSICSFDFSFVQNGTSGVSSVLSNDSAVVSTLSDGSGGTYGGGNLATTMSVYVGSVDDSANWTFSQALSGCTVTASGSPANRTATVTNMTTDNATVVFTATRSGYPTQTCTFTLSKSKQGATPTAYWLINDVSVIQKNMAGTLSPASINLTGKSQVGTNAPANYTGRFVVEESTNGGGAYTSKYTSASDEATKNYVPSGSTVTNIRVSLYQSGGTTNLLDQQIIPIVSDGNSTLTCYLTNESATVATDQNGNNGVYTGTNTDIHVYDGATEVLYDGVGTANGTWKVTATAGGITAGTITDAGNYASVGVVSAITADQATVTYTITGKGYSGQAISFTKIQTFSRAKTGVAPTSYWLVSDNSAIQKNISNVFSPTSINLTGKSQTGGGTPANYSGRFIIEESTNGGGAYTSKYTSASDEATKNYVPSGSTVTNIRVSLYQAGGTTNLLDQQVINVVSDGQTGAPSIIAYCWAPSGSVVRNNSGSITAECDVYVGSTLTTAGVTYQWYKYVVGTADQGGGVNWLKLASGSDGGGTTGWTGQTLTIPASAIDSMDTYKCIALYNSKTYTDMITVQDQSDPIQLSLIADTGNVFRNGQGANKNVTCKVYQSGQELDVSGSIYQYQWTLRDQTGTVSSTFVDYTITNPGVAPTLATATTGGSLAAATYYVKYTWVTSFGETMASSEASIITTGTTSTVTVTIPALPAHVTSANIYMSTATGTEKLQGSTVSTSYTRSTALLAVTAPPVSNTASATYKSGKTVVVGAGDVTNLGNLVCTLVQ